MCNANDAWPTAGPIDGVIFDIHSTLIDQGDADQWLDAAVAVAPHPLSPSERGELVGCLDRIWEGARIIDPDSSRDLSFEAHARVFHELIAAGPRVDASLAQALYDVMLDSWHAYDDTIPTLRALREEGIRVCLLSNAGVRIHTEAGLDNASDLYWGRTAAVWDANDTATLKDRSGIVIDSYTIRK